MTTPLSICSSALLMIGADELSSFEEGSREAKLCANLYDVTLDDLLQLYPWRFATVQSQLPKLASEPLFGFRHAYQLPPKLLRILTTDGDQNYRRFENTLFSNAGQLQITYLQRPPENRLPAYFVRIVELKMAEILALALQEDAAKSRLMAEKAQAQILRARGVDAQQQTTPLLAESNFSLTQVRS